MSLVEEVHQLVGQQGLRQVSYESLEQRREIMYWRSQQESVNSLWPRVQVLLHGVTKRLYLLLVSRYTQDPLLPQSSAF